MCILILKEAGHTITKKVLRRCFDANPNGAGMAYVNTDYQGVSRVKIKKNMTFNNFYARLRVAEHENPASPFIIHFRITTHGGTRIENNHPFRVERDTVMAHNGILTEMGRKTKGKESDTRAFNRLILQKLPKGWQNNEACKFLIEDYITGSKMAILNSDYTYQIYREHMGEWVDGAWYSNTSYKKRVAYTPYRAPASTKKWGRGNGWGQSSYKAPAKPAGKGKEPVKFTPKPAIVNPPVLVKPESPAISKIKLVQNKETEKSEVHRKCDCCGVFHALAELSFYTLNSYDAECYCGDCSETMLKNYIVNPDEEITYCEYLDIVDLYQYSKSAARSDSLEDSYNSQEYYGD